MHSYSCVINPRRACAARVTVLGLCVCVCVCLHLFSPYQAGSSAIPTALVNPRRACAARVTVLGLCVCVSVCVFVSTYSHPTGTKPAHQRYQQLWCNKGSKSYVAILLKWRRSRDMALKQATKPPTSTDRYRFRLSGTLAVLRWRGASAQTILAS